MSDATSAVDLCAFDGDRAFPDVAFSPDGRVVSAGRDGSVKIRDPATGQVILERPGTGEERVSWVFGDASGVARTRVAFSPDGRRIASTHTADPKYRITIWDARSGEDILTLRGHTGPVDCIAFSRDGRKIASGSFDKSVKLWNGATGKELLTLLGHGNWIYRVAFRGDGRQLASASIDDTVKVWDTANGEELLTLRGHTDSVCSVAYSPDGRRIVSGGTDGTARLWDGDTGREILLIRGRGSVWDAAFSPDGMRLATAYERAGVEIRDAVPWGKSAEDTNSLSPDRQPTPDR